MDLTIRHLWHIVECMANIAYLLTYCKKDVGLLKNFISNYYPQYQLNFDTSGRAGKNNSLEIKEDASNKDFYLLNYNEHRYAIPNGNLSNQILHITKHLDGFDRVKRQIEILKDLGVNIEEGNISQEASSPASPEASSPAITITPTLRINQLKSENQKIILEYENFTTNIDGGGQSITPLGKAVCDYFDKKCGVTMNTADAVFESFGIRPIKSKTILSDGKKYKFNYTPQDFAYSVGTGDSLKIKQPKQKKYKNIWIQNVYDYAFGFNAVIGDGGTCLICGGEEDAICINTHFCDMPNPLVAVAVGSETKPINPLLIKRLKREFDDVAICFDFDDVGLFNARKNAKELDIPYLDFSNAMAMLGYDPNKSKDVCDIWQNVALNASYNDFIKVIEYTVQESI